ncbi:MAG: 1-deoxy-D-xylulose-5-phosphate reductoisomerase, partial [Erysipelotrichia bacterium]|nr:1-deoxy-D-xylulose-5-phosphate reductoisomerase [Erysipelotrichia bacterium]
MRKKVIILGASGSIGSQTIDVLLQHAELFEIIGLSVGNNIKVLEQFLSEHSLKYACVKNYADYLKLKEQFTHTKFFYGNE